MKGTGYLAALRRAGEHNCERARPCQSPLLLHAPPNWDGSSFHGISRYPSQLTLWLVRGSILLRAAAEFPLLGQLARCGIKFVTNPLRCGIKFKYRLGKSLQLSAIQRGISPIHMGPHAHPPLPAYPGAHSLSYVVDAQGVLCACKPIGIESIRRRQTVERISRSLLQKYHTSVFDIDVVVLFEIDHKGIEALLQVCFHLCFHRSTWSKQRPLAYHWLKRFWRRSRRRLWRGWLRLLWWAPTLLAWHQRRADCFLRLPLQRPPYVLVAWRQAASGTHDRLELLL